jgi:hypothetical protein
LVIQADSQLVPRQLDPPLGRFQLGAEVGVLGFEGVVVARLL